MRELPLSDYLEARVEQLKEQRDQAYIRIEQLEKENADLKTAREYWRSLHDERTRFLGEAVAQLTAKDELLREAEKALGIGRAYVLRSNNRWRDEDLDNIRKTLSKLQSSDTEQAAPEPDQQEAVAYLKEDTFKDRDGNRVFHLCSRYDRGAFPVYTRPVKAVRS